MEIGVLMNSENNENRDKWIDIISFTIFLAFVSCVMLTLFSRQTLGSPEKYHSDMKAYILEMQGLDSGYSFPYPVFFKLAAVINLFTSPEFAVALAAMLLNSLAIIVTKLMLERYAYKTLRGAFTAAEESRKSKGFWYGRSYLAGIIISLITVSLFFVSMLFPLGRFYLPGIKYNYLGVFTGNPFHNATYIAARPFAVLAFFQYASILEHYEEGCRDKRTLTEYILFSFTLLAATMTKPSFTIVLVGAAGLIMLYRMFKSKFKNFIPTLQLGLCFIPTFIDLLYQFNGVFVPNEGVEGGIGFSFGEVWGYYCSNIPLAILLAIGFPVLVFLFNYKEIKTDTVYRFSWQIYWMSFAMAFLLYEKGFRKPDFNFSWGYMYGIFFAFVGAVLVLLKKTAACLASKDRAGSVRVLLQWCAFMAHLVCGLYYFGIIFKGGMYY